MDICLINFPLIVAVLPLKDLYIITIISRSAPFVIVVVAGHGSCCKIFGIWKNRLLSNPFWKLICGILGWVPTRDMFLWLAIFPDTDLMATLVSSDIWLDIWTSSRATAISTTAALEVNLLKSLFDWLLNGQIVWLRKWRLVLRLLLYCSRFPLILIEKTAILMHSLLYKGIIGDELLWWYYIHVTHTKFVDKLCNLLVLLSFPMTESGIRSILKSASGVP